LLPPCRAGAPQTCFGLAAPRGLLGERADIRSFSLLLPFAQDRFAALETDSQLSTSFQDKIVAFWRHTPMVFSRKHEGLLPKQDTVWFFCKTRNGSWLEKPTKKSWRLTKKNRLNFWPQTWYSTLSRVPCGFFLRSKNEIRPNSPAPPLESVQNRANPAVATHECSVPP